MFSPASVQIGGIKNHILIDHKHSVPRERKTPQVSWNHNPPEYYFQLEKVIRPYKKPGV